MLRSALAVLYSYLINWINTADFITYRCINEGRRKPTIVNTSLISVTIRQTVDSRTQNGGCQLSCVWDFCERDQFLRKSIIDSLWARRLKYYAVNGELTHHTGMICSMQHTHVYRKMLIVTLPVTQHTLLQRLWFCFPIADIVTTCFFLCVCVCVCVCVSCRWFLFGIWYSSEVCQDAALQHTFFIYIMTSAVQMAVCFHLTSVFPVAAQVLQFQ